jgi:hypothetical protein
MRLKRSAALALLLGALAVAACRVDSAGPSPYTRLDPIVDSLFVGDQSPPPAVTYYDGTGNSVSVSPLQVSWSSTDSTILGVNSLSGRLTGRKRGHAFLLATFQSVQGVALVVVSNTLDLTLLLDTIYLMPNDTLTVPVAVQKKTVPPAPVVWYESKAPGVYTIDSASGRLTAVALGGPVPYVVHADTIADTGAVQVLSLTDTTGGKVFFSALGSVITHVGGPISAVNYTRSDVGLAFRLRGTYAPNGTTLQVVQITLTDSVALPGTYRIDSLSPAEAIIGFSRPVSICAPPRPWALWSARSPSITAYSRPGGQLGITQIVTVSNGQAISGSFSYAAQRADLYTDPHGVLAVRGSFVAPLVRDPTACR